MPPKKVADDNMIHNPLSNRRIRLSGATVQEVVKQHVNGTLVLSAEDIDKVKSVPKLARLLTATPVRSKTTPGKSRSTSPKRSNAVTTFQDLPAATMQHIMRNLSERKDIGNFLMASKQIHSTVDVHRTTSKQQYDAYVQVLHEAVDLITYEPTPENQYQAWMHFYSFIKTHPEYNCSFINIFAFSNGRVPTTNKSYVEHTLDIQQLLDMNQEKFMLHKLPHYRKHPNEINLLKLKIMENNITAWLNRRDGFFAPEVQALENYKFWKGDPVFEPLLLRIIKKFVMSIRANVDLPNVSTMLVLVKNPELISHDMIPKILEYCKGSVWGNYGMNNLIEMYCECKDPIVKQAIWEFAADYIQKLDKTKIEKKEIVLAILKRKDILRMTLKDPTLARALYTKLSSVTISLTGKRTPQVYENWMTQLQKAAA